MPNRSSKDKRPRDFNQRAMQIVREAKGEEPKYNPEEEGRQKNPHAVALGQLGGKKGGRARAAKMTPEERSEAARKAALARWSRSDGSA